MCSTYLYDIRYEYLYRVESTLFMQVIICPLSQYKEGRRSKGTSLSPSEKDKGRGAHRVIHRTYCAALEHHSYVCLSGSSEKPRASKKKEKLSLDRDQSPTFFFVRDGRHGDRGCAQPRVGLQPDTRHPSDCKSQPESTRSASR